MPAPRAPIAMPRSADRSEHSGVGWTNPARVDGESGIIAGHGRLHGRQKLGLERAPVIELGHISEAQKRRRRPAENQFALNAGWDEKLLRLELADLFEPGLRPRADRLRRGRARAPAGGQQGRPTEDDEAPALPEQAVAQPGDLRTWVTTGSFAVT